ncbi:MULTISPECIES: hypothetical protein [Actinoalloteichus]|uniref:Uncharacterized protein n=1 Tax=Actinoalloteichus fjordicus TaxID=1612552 RepID=A0AAC9LG57_9PSEU|nr:MULTISPECIES: hypothetical protein [Actinoalloteichus]APU17101.1 hypothetical protein UA74_25470 [Actinoalloteichus fjordicus]APU23183.1 hypothetical protein UA75_26050 [Actinoalloteichus sp. GBA129-24]
MNSPLFVVKDELSSPVCVSYTTGGRPVVAIRRGQVFSPEFAQALSDALSAMSLSATPLGTTTLSAAGLSTTGQHVTPAVPRQADKERNVENEIPARWAPATTRAALRSTRFAR